MREIESVIADRGYGQDHTLSNNWVFITRYQSHSNLTSANFKQSALRIRAASWHHRLHFIPLG